MENGLYDKGMKDVRLERVGNGDAGDCSAKAMALCRGRMVCKAVRAVVDVITMIDGWGIWRWEERRDDGGC